MTPEQARGWLDAYKSKDFEERLQAEAYIDEMAVEMAEMIAAMTVEESGRVVSIAETGGDHEVRSTYRLVSEWRDKEPNDS